MRPYVRHERRARTVNGADVFIVAAVAPPGTFAFMVVARSINTQYSGAHGAEDPEQPYLLRERQLGMAECICIGLSSWAHFVRVICVNVDV